MSKINVTSIKANEDTKTQLKQEIARAKEEVRILNEQYLYPKLEESKKEVFNSLETYFNGVGFDVERSGDSDLTASYGDQKIEIILSNNKISVVHNRKEVEEIILSPRRNHRGSVSSTFHSGDKDPEISRLELELKSLQKDITNLKEINIYYHYSLGVDLDFSKVIANIFQ
ncbi:hypothetical protein CNQ87_10640 [Lysinibacillus fusiformis]|uniref:hypothetical protein n=1 Tax=Lysinibacillus fusiformis TaxID=28031 RepID=UPI000BBAA728|nr:hypothetical protein [Lysinibacillus fusiformis]PCD84790.1 hypothetical protein CNQ87_10640 [Lysinibacillus fusiformis]